MEKYYVMKKSLVITKTDSEFVLWDAQNGSEFFLDDNLLDILRHFSLPATLEAAHKIICNNYDMDFSFFYEIVTEMVEKGVLELYRPEKIEFFKGRGGIFNSDVIELSECLKSDWCDIAFLGMPYDLNVTYKPGTRFGPSYLRRVSNSVFQVKSGNKGMYDPVGQKQLLKDVNIVDLGDIKGTVFSRNGTEFDYLENISYKIVNNGSLLVTLGGDHSISSACIAGMTKLKKKIKVIQFDAHADFGNLDMENWREDLHHGNFIDKVVKDNLVDQVIQIGIRQLIDEKLTHSKVIQWPGKTIFEKMSEFIETLNEEDFYYVSIDVDVFDPTVIRHTGTPLPGGFSFDELMQVLKIISSKVNIIGIDVVELLSSEDDIDGIIISKMLVEFLDGIMTRKIEVNHGNLSSD